MAAMEAEPAVLDRRQRWAAFSVQAHKDLGGLASDLLLYERLVLPVSADESELERWQEQDWNPEVIALREVQGAGRIFTVPWTKELRDEHRQIMGLQRLAGEIGYGLTAGLLASGKAWPEIVAGLDPRPSACKPAVSAFLRFWSPPSSPNRRLRPACTCAPLDPRSRCPASAKLTLPWHCTCRTSSKNRSRTIPRRPSYGQ
jgi:hypothetical protein